MDRLRNVQPVQAANAVIGALLVTGAVGNFIAHSFSSIIIGIYALVLGAIILGLELVPIPPRYVSLIGHYASFLHSFAGRGVCYVLFGILLLNHYVLLYVSGSIIAFIGVVFIVLEFVQTFDPSPSMTASQAGGYDEETQPVWSAGEV